MFTGQFERSIDAKHRVILPPNFKTALGNIFYLTIASEQKLEIRPVGEFEALVTQLEALNQLDPVVQKYKRFVMASSIKIETDKLGRFLIPEKFLAAAAVKTTITFVGMGRTIELWASEILTNQLVAFADDEFISDITQQLLAKGIKL